MSEPVNVTINENTNNQKVGKIYVPIGDAELLKQLIMDVHNKKGVWGEILEVERENDVSTPYGNFTKVWTKAYGYSVDLAHLLFCTSGLALPFVEGEPLKRTVIIERTPEGYTVLFAPNREEENLRVDAERWERNELSQQADELGPCGLS